MMAESEDRQERERAVVSKLLATLDWPVIVNLGAYHGEDAAWMRDACDGRCFITSIEADPRNFDILNMAVLEYNRNPESRWTGNHIAIHGAIAAKVGSVDFWVCENAIGQGRGSGSIRRPTGHLKYFPWCTFPRTVKVPAFTLDYLFTFERWGSIDLLWVDIQGAERDMIAGGQKALKQTRYLMIEAEEQEFYEGQATKSELLGLLPEFEIVEEFGYNCLMRNKTLTETA